MSEITVIGASSPLGTHLLARLAAETIGRVRVLVHRQRPTPPPELRGRFVEIPGDLLKPDTILPALVPGGIVFNLAVLVPYRTPPGRHAADDVLQGAAGARNLGRACADVGVSQLIHCSSVSVVGPTKARVVTEDTPCGPITPYACVKLEEERVLEEEARDRFRLTIARPTSMLGSGHRTLIAHCDALLHGPRALNYLRASLLGRRPERLCCAENVAAALLWLARRASRDARTHAPVERFIVSEDDVATNNHQDVERLLRAALGLPEPRLPRLPIPLAALSAIHALRGRPEVRPRTVFDGGRLLQTGFVRAVALDEAITRFGVRYRETADATGHGGRATLGASA